MLHLAPLDLDLCCQAFSNKSAPESTKCECIALSFGPDDHYSVGKILYRQAELREQLK